MDMCFLCKSKQRDTIKYGEFMTSSNISVHYFCLLLTSNLLQKGRDDQGFLGFLVADIRKEAARVAPAVCCYCREKSANISCCAAKCRKSFHLTCGIKNNVENQFVGTFKSFCHRHVARSLKKVLPPPDETCCICYEELTSKGSRSRNSTNIQAPCCKNGWFHKYCLAAFASSAGYFFKCPLCNDNKVFRERLVYRGIFIPDRDAAWELEPNAFAELLERPEECCAIVCNARGGRSSSNNMNSLLFCGSCGSTVIHRNCLAIPTDMFYCDECSPVIASVASVQNPAIVNITASQQTATDDEEEIDVCNIDTEVPALNHTQNQDEGLTVEPFGKKKSYRIFQKDNRSLKNGENYDDDIGLSRNCTDMELSSHNVDSSACEAKERDSVASQDAESLFDSGTESDRPENSAEKTNINNEPLDPKIIKDSLGDCVNQADEIVEMEPIGNIKEQRPEKRKFTSLNDEPSGGVCVAKRIKIKRQSSSRMSFSKDNTDIADVDCNVSEMGKSALLSSSSSSTSRDSDKIAEATSTSLNEVQVQSQIKTTLDPISFKIDPTKLIDDRRLLDGSRRRSHCTNIELKTFTRNEHRLRTNSEDPSKSPSALHRVKRRSFTRGPYGRLRPIESLKCSEKLRSSINDRSRSNSKTNCKKLSESGEIENTCHAVDTFRNHKSTRDRSPLSSNLCSLYAYITPTYVRKNETTKRGADILVTSASSNQHTAFESAKPFTLNDSNIPQTTNEDAAKPANKPVSSTTSSCGVGNARDTYVYSYDILMHNDKTKSRESCDLSMYAEKPKSHKHRIKRHFTDQHMPKNQTKIESFFRRI